MQLRKGTTWGHRHGVDAVKVGASVVLVEVMLVEKTPTTLTKEEHRGAGEEDGEDGGRSTPASRPFLCSTITSASTQMAITTMASTTKMMANSPSSVITDVLRHYQIKIIFLSFVLYCRW